MSAAGLDVTLAEMVAAGEVALGADGRYRITRKGRAARASEILAAVPGDQHCDALLMLEQAIAEHRAAKAGAESCS